MSHLCALTADGGLPLFSRRTNDLKLLPFATIGVLNGLHMFSDSRGATLQSSRTSKDLILWKVYHNKIVLILVTRNDSCGDCHYQNLLDNVFASLVMMVGIDGILNTGNIEKLKRDFKPCYNMIDFLLNQFDEENLTVCDLTQRVDTLLSYDTPFLANYLEKFLENAECAFGWLNVRGKVACASKLWWTLPQQELLLLSILINSFPKSPSQDIPIFLPISSPRVCNRLITLQLLRGIELCVLCESTPTLSFLEEEAPKVWKSSFELLKTMLDLHPRNFPANVLLDRNIIGVLLINTERNHTMCSLCPDNFPENMAATERSALMRKRQEAIRTLYQQIVGTHFDEFSITLMKPDENTTDKNCNGTQYKCEVQEFYLCLENHKGYAINSPPFQIFIAYNNDVPYYALRSVSQKTLKSLTIKKLML